MKDNIRIIIDFSPFRYEEEMTPNQIKLLESNPAALGMKILHMMKEVGFPKKVYDIKSDSVDFKTFDIPCC